MEVLVVEGIDLFGYLKYFYPDLELDTFLVETLESDFIFLFFLGISSYGVTLALVSPINP